MLWFTQWLARNGLDQMVTGEFISSRELTKRSMISIPMQCFNWLLFTHGIDTLGFSRFCVENFLPEKSDHSHLTHPDAPVPEYLNQFFSPQKRRRYPTILNAYCTSIQMHCNSLSFNSISGQNCCDKPYWVSFANSMASLTSE
ncbi:MAG: hypothetical protein Ct9H300mP4_09730 [Gammaproteobacteria bacterium]|nr:MAG: hypothetical protein Ct9H300mP4_09730 [Gammaproteobacteria bacterium]